MRNLTTAALLLAPAAAATGQTFTWVGGDAGLWSDPSNWDNGVPASGGGVTLVSPGGTNDLPGLSVGELRFVYDIFGPAYWPGWSGERLTVTDLVRVDDLTDTAPQVPFDPESPVRLSGGVTIRATGFDTFTPEARYGGAPLFFDAELDGDLTIDGHASIPILFGQGGTLRVEPGSAFHGPAGVDGFPAPATFDVVEVLGTIDAGLLDLNGTGTVDASAGLIARGSAVNTLGSAISSRMAVDGNLILGDWANGGAESGFGFGAPLAERIDVTGTLDLTQANLLYDGITAEIYGDEFPPADLPDSFVLASYGTRIGTFPQTTFDLNLFDGLFGDSLTIPGTILYTSGENAGPGQVIVALPEPAAAGLLGGIGFLALTRRRGRRLGYGG